MLEFVEVSDLPGHGDTSLKDALAQQQNLVGSSHNKPDTPRLHVERAGSLAELLNLRGLFCFKQKDGCDNLPPSVQGHITPCSSSGTPQRVGTQRQRSDADVCGGAVDVSSTSSSGSGTSCTAAACAGATGASSSNNGIGGTEGLAAQLPARSAQQHSSIFAFCAAKAQKLRKQSTQAMLLPPDCPTAAQQVSSFRLPLLTGKTRKASCQQHPSLPPLSLNSRPVHPKRQRRAVSFEASGRENIRLLLGPLAVCGSITRYKMLLMAEQVHENQLQDVVNQTVEQVDWAGEPAWEDNFSVVSSKYGQRVRACLFWWGGALAHLRWKGEPEECCAEEAAAQVAVVVPGNTCIPEESCDSVDDAKALSGPGCLVQP